LKILVIEDEVKIAQALKEGLEHEHFKVTVAGTGEEGFFALSSQRFDLLILDIMLPGRNGFEILQALRQTDPSLPVLVLTARDGVADRVHGFKLGADDYLIKPFAFEELLARVGALLRRRGGPVTELRFGDMELNLLTRSVKRQGTPIELTAKEFELLEFFMRNEGKVISRNLLQSQVWKDPARATSMDNIIDVHIARLRKKIESDFGDKLIQTVRGSGFILRREQDA
jgi:two-component system, OmpR family, copper resistance phosphate regulon response regulator CusR